ncbi:MAG: hypothetical protein HGA44_16385, partial [Cellulomonadaceae bacterium]|nr:hypothetical protein [Cellulomonadaceae bacterium]
MTAGAGGARRRAVALGVVLGPLGVGLALAAAWQLGGPDVRVTLTASPALVLVQVGALASAAVWLVRRSRARTSAQGVVALAAGRAEAQD